MVVLTIEQLINTWPQVLISVQYVVVENSNKNTTNEIALFENKPGILTIKKAFLRSH